MCSPTRVLLVTYMDDNDDLMEYVLPVMSHPQVELIQHFLDDRYPDGGANASVVRVVDYPWFTEAFDGDLEEFAAAGQEGP